MKLVTAVEMSRAVGIDPKRFRQALRDEQLDWHEHDSSWTVAEGSQRHQDMIRALNRLSKRASKMTGTESAGDVKPRTRREEASSRCAPSSTRLLFVAESPPASPERYFHFPEVRTHDHLWLALMEALYQDDFGATKLERQRKHGWLTKFQRDGYRLVDAYKDPMPKVSESKKRHLLGNQCNNLVSEIRSIAPEQILMIKATVYDALYISLKKAGLPVIDARLPFPGSGRQVEFQKGFKKLVNDGMLIL